MTVEIHANLVRTGYNWSGDLMRHEKPVVAKGKTREEADNALTMMVARYRTELYGDGCPTAKAWADIIPTPEPDPPAELNMDALHEGIKEAVIGWVKTQPLESYDIFSEGDTIYARLNPIWGGRIQIVIQPPIQHWNYEREELA